MGREYEEAMTTSSIFCLETGLNSATVWQETPSLSQVHLYISRGKDTELLS